MRKTKIVCTLGPAVNSYEAIKGLAEAGMNVARFNFSHGSHKEHGERLAMVRKVRNELGIPLAALLDTKGPEIRIGKFAGDQKINLHVGDNFTLTAREIEGDQNAVSISFKGLPGDVRPGSSILIDDGLVGLEVKEIKGEDIICTVLNDGTISNNKSVNVPGLHLSLPYMSEKDKSDVAFAVEAGYDFIAASFVRTAKDVLEIRKVLSDNNCNWIKIISKIENSQGVDNIDEILEVSDGLMVARGDLGVEVPFEDIPSIQKMMIKKARAAGKTVITATQMLDSMIRNPRPTRAEVTDVANAIYDGTTAIMLSGETANGDYPVEAVQTMVKIAERTEADIDYATRLKNFSPNATTDSNQQITDAIAHATCTTAHDLNVAAIVTVSSSGFTANELSKYRPVQKIIACTPQNRVYRQLALSWGVKPMLIEKDLTGENYLPTAVEQIMDSKDVSKGDKVVFTMGLPFGVTGMTNILRVQIIGEDTTSL